MIVPDFNYRINPERAIYLVGDFNDQLLREVLPRITELRFKNKEPISVIISSYGGEASCMEALLSSLSVVDPDGATSHVITSVTGMAASAGAILLTLGNYAIATPSSVVHFHGTRVSEKEVTTESASQVASSLSIQNRIIANRMSRVMIGRVVHRFARLKKDINELRKKLNKPNLPLARAFVTCAEERTNTTADRIFDKAIERLARVKKVSSEVLRIKPKPGELGCVADAKVLKRVIDYELKLHKSPEWRLDQAGVQQIMSDYMLIREFYFGEYRGVLENIIAVWGLEFLALEKMEEYKAKKAESDETASKYLIDQVSVEVGDFWYLTVSIARALLQGENRLTATDAYWLGAIDEITGSDDCYGMRALVERDPEDLNPTSAGPTKAPAPLS